MTDNALAILIQRRPPIGDAIPGECHVDGRLFAFSLERRSKAIPAGRYPVRFTVSARATSGELWSPDPLHRLPLIDQVPGRTGIRIHAANEAEELEGCIAVGQRLAGPTLLQSRAAVTPLIDLIAAATDPIWIDVVDATATTGVLTA